jgi:alanyl-tRNA synthetase
MPGCHPNCDCERFVELWNLVFMQFYQDAQGRRTLLPAPGVDTGMGLERAAAVLQGKASIYETDLFWPVIQKICEISSKSYGADPDTDYALRVVAEHTRASSFLIGDGVVPGNEGRSYVLRRVIRRAIRYGRRLGLDEPFLTQVAETVMPVFRHVYREMLENHDFILRVIRLEEERFARTYDDGNSILRGMIAIRRKAEPHMAGVVSGVRTGTDNPSEALQALTGGNGHAEDSNEGIGQELAFDALMSAVTEKLVDAVLSWPGQISGKETFVLYDTYGFPPELTAEIAREHGLDVDMEGFEREMGSQRERARAAHAFTGSMEVVTAYENLGVDRTGFVGYDGLQGKTVVAAILVSPSTSPGRTEPVTPGSAEPAGHATQGQKVELVLEETPFYAEGGGQVGDRGTISGPNGLIRVEDTQSPVAGLTVHRGIVEEGDVSLGEKVFAQVDPARRRDAARNHSGTHLLHASLRAVLGPHVRQAGSLVSPDRLRFDFSHVSPLSGEEVGSVQDLANERIRDNLQVSAHETTYAEAVREGALAFFGDRYGDVVRVVAMSGGEPLGGDHLENGRTAEDGPFSLEVCGGTHVTATGQVGTLFVLGESSIGGGMRRIEAVTGQAAERLFVDHAAKLESLSRKLQTPVADLETRLDTFIRDTEELRRRLASLERTALRNEAETMLKRVEEVEGVNVVAGRTSATNPEAMREMGDFLRTRLSSVVVVLSAVINGSPLLVTMVTPDLVDKGLHAGNLARDTAKVMGGGGGGRPEMAQAGGKQVEKLEEALQAVPGLVRQSLS